MATIVKNLTIKKGFGPGKVSSQVKSHASDPVVIKKVEEAEQTIQSVGLPGQKRK